MSTPNGPCSNKLPTSLTSSFKLLRITPTIYNQWVTIAPNDTGIIPNGSTLNPPCAYLGITGVALATQPYKIISWPGTTWRLADSTIIAPYNTVTGYINVNLNLPQALQNFGSCVNDANDFIQATCLLNNVPAPVAQNCYASADGVPQFIAQICASPSLQFNSNLLNLIIQPPVFPYSVPASHEYAQCTPSSRVICGYGNYSFLYLSLGGNVCSDVITLVYVGCAQSCATTPVVQNGIEGLTCEGLEVVDANPHQYIYANTRLYLAKKDGSLANFSKACYIAVEPDPCAVDRSCFYVFFGQTRLCNGVNILLISCLVDLSCLYWGNRVYIITAAAPNIAINNLA